MGILMLLHGLWNNVGTAVDVPSLEVFKTRLDGVLGNLI